MSAVTTLTLNDALSIRGVVILPRIIRLRDAPNYLGMDKNRFNAEVRPFTIEMNIGNHGIGFDRLDLDRWVDDYKQRTGRSNSLTGIKTWDKQKLGPAVSILKAAEVKPSAKLGKVNESSNDSIKLAKKKLKVGCTRKSKGESASENVNKALAICLQSVQRAI